MHDDQTYSRHLKRLINYLRCEIKPHRPEDKAYHLYVTHGGGLDREYFSDFKVPSDHRDHR